MRRQIQFRFVAKFLIACFVLAAGVHALHAVQVHRNIGTLVLLADQAAERGDVEHATTFYGQYLNQQKGDIEALARFGLFLDRNINDGNDRQRVVDIFQRVLRADKTRQDVRRRLIPNLMALLRLREAETEIRDLLPSAKDSEVADLEHKLGWCLEATGDYAESVQAFGRATKSNPHSLASYDLEAEVWQRRLHDEDEATRVLGDMIAKNADSAAAYLIRHLWEKERNALADAEADLQKATLLEPENTQVLLAAADWSRGRGDLENARAIVEKGRNLDPKNASFLKALVQIEIRAGRRAEAVKLLEKGTVDFPLDLDMAVLLTDLLVDVGRLDDAAAQLEGLVQAQPSSALVSYLKARIAVAHGLWTEAAADLEKARAELGTGTPWSSRVHALLGACYEARGDLEGELSSFRKAVAAEPDFSAAHLGLGSALLNAGRVEEALTELREASLAADASPLAWTALARAFIERNRRGREKDWRAVDKALEQATAAAPGAVEILILQAEALFGQGKSADAEKLLEAARATHPTESALTFALADIYSRDGKEIEADEVMRRLRANQGDNAAWRLARLRQIVARDDAGEELTSLGDDLERFSGLERGRLFRALAAAWMRRGDLPKARDFWERVAQNDPRDVGSRTVLLEIALRDNQAGAAERYLRDIRQIEGETGPHSLYGQAAIWAAASPAKLDDAQRLLSQLLSMRDDWTAAYLLAGRIQEKQKQFDLAFASYLRAFDLGERDKAFVSRLVKDLSERPPHSGEALRVVARMEEEETLTPELAHLGAEMALANQDTKRALDLARAAVPEATRDYREWLWLARVQQSSGRSSESSLQKAVELGGHAPDTWLALVEYLARHGQRSSAEEVMGRARQTLPWSRWQSAEPRFLEALGQIDRAKSAYEQLVKQGPTDFILMAQAADFYLRVDQPSQAEPLFATLAGSNTPAPREIQNRAKQELALLWASGADPAKRERAGALLADIPVSPANDRIRWSVQGADPAKRDRVLEDFESSVRQFQANSQEKFRLARLNLTAGNNERVDELLTGLLATEPDNAQFIAFTVRFLIETDARGRAAVLFQRLEQLQPEYARTLQLRRVISMKEK